MPGLAAWLDIDIPANVSKKLPESVHGTSGDEKFLGNRAA
jgi:hypothetical protein